MQVNLRTTVFVLVIAALLGASVFREPIAAATLAAKGAMEVLVTNDATQPVPVREQARTAPVQVTTFATFDGGQRFSSTANLYTVPAGKILVIDSLGAGSNMDPADRLMDVQVSLSYNDIVPYVVVVHAADEGVFTATGARIFRGTLTTTAYAAPGTTVSAFGTRDGAALSSTALRIALSGRLIDAP